MTMREASKRIGLGLTAAALAAIVAGCGRSEPAQNGKVNKETAQRAGLANGTPATRTAKPPFDPTK